MMKTLQGWVFAGAWFTVAATAVGGEPRGSFALTREGKPLAVIVTAEEPTAVADFAAAELQYHVQQITGAVLPIVTEGTKVTGPRILVGKSEAAQADPSPRQSLLGARST